MLCCLCFSDASQQAQCKLPGCTKQTTKGKDRFGEPFEYCSRQHALDGKEANQPKQNPMIVPAVPPSVINAFGYPQITKSICAKPGCGKPVSVGTDASGHPLTCCSRDHAVQIQLPVQLCAFAGCGKPVATGTDSAGRPFTCCSRDHAVQIQPAAQVCALAGCGKPVATGTNRAGRPFTFCSRDHAVQIQPAAQVCALAGCGKPVATGTNRAGRPFTFCSRDHAVQIQPPGQVCALAGCGKPVATGTNRAGRPFTFCSRDHAVQIQPPGQVCALAGCGKPVSSGLDRAGRPFAYCCRDHALQLTSPSTRRLDLTAGSAKAQELQDVDYVWEQTGASCYEVRVLNPNHDKYQSVVKQFNDSVVWPDPSQPGDPPKPKIVKVMQVWNTKHVYEAYEKYKSTLANPTETRRFHGTTMDTACEFGMDPTKPPCNSNECAVCNICRSSFRLDKAGQGPLRHTAVGKSFGPEGRYGYGLYFSRHSRKSHDYNAGTARDINGKSLRVMFLCKVVEGEQHVTDKMVLKGSDLDQILRIREQGGTADSVVANGGDRNGPLRFHEVVVYHENAAIPSYLVVYEMT